ncbi:MAG: hypothetical protein COZ06_21390 [Armatimonadetes bacterium CG_4_10_14_3_um_filter_66_18]|nr:GNAT family N-acetyltransferase [Armatimonadota bacterium]OIO92355.1 MAG: hypothetical protein AUJ96_32370 [Armatimonadetes bacterium CG2_30_66_41]PIU93572.1 MAG: hypothetical protein COS65_12070 [Armatimonadetes bacterium CG06_land_8_20_14_3_00_66_21]PIX38538.1 MAG: hypothetical protein COZ57_30300 [Armatimonadetes bacterium CG_4_8_14_3_um_filter_66_20]PIY44070.1 MAG: hypothetical protein COZ06_21390 [Armatimonadetes bacterium CG_4_10_14_3_um_filter_66_18]PIZ48463.1 MAG: hypothetical prote
MSFVIRNEKPDDWPQILEVMCAAFGNTPERWAAMYPELYGADKGKSRPHLVAEEDGKLLGSLGIYPDVIRVGKARLRNGGLGAVATVPEARGQGIMTELLAETNRQMLAEGYDVSLLGGDRLRYSRYGWERTGSVRQLSVSAKYLRAGGVKAWPVRRCRAADRDQVRKVYGRYPFGSLRSARVFFSRLERSGAELYCVGQGRSFLYAAVQPGDHPAINEILGAAASAPGFVGGLLKSLKADSVSVRLPDFADPLREALLPFATTHSQSPLRQLQLVNLPSVLEKTRDLLEEELAELRWRECLCVGIPERKQYVTLIRKTTGGLMVEPVRTTPCLDLDWRAAARLVFGGLPGEFDAVCQGPFKVLRELFPLKWFFFPADNV